MASAVTNLSNDEIVTAIGLPKSIVTDLRTAEGSAYGDKMNEFLTNLVNKIVYQKVDMLSFTNPFKRFDSFPVEFGDTIENIFVELPNGYTFDPNDTDPFKKYIPSVRPLYASINYRFKYTTTIEDKQMKQACLNPNGFMQLIDSFINGLGVKKDIDEYTATLTMLDNKDLYANGIEELTIPASATPLEKYKTVTQKIVDVVTDFAIPSVSNNKMKTLNACPKNRTLLVIKNDILNHINLDYLAGVFNLSKVDLINNIIPVRSFNTIENTITDANGVVTASPSVVGDDIDFCIIDSGGFDNHSCLQQSGSIYNPSALYTNHFTHDWRIFGYKLFRNARAFKLA